MRLAAFAFLVGCGARTGLDVPEPGDANIDVRVPHDAALDVALDDADAGVDAPVLRSPFCVANDAGIPEHVCTTNLAVGNISKMASGCYVDVVVHEGDMGVVRYACDDPSSTWAEVTFGANTFPGSINGTLLDVCIGTVYPWQDGANCNWSKSTWASSQRIYGDIASGTLTFVYDEQEVSGFSCDIPCWAQGNVTTQ